VTALRGARADGALARLAAAAPSLAPRLEALARAAASEAPVLILGEPGTGRSALARAIHADSERAGAPLVEVDAAAIPATLFESELFGHRPGAFTGADRVHLGRVARAEGGTLLLDQIEQLPLAVQPKLLRLLAERRYHPLGGGEVAADVRFVAIGPGDLAARIDAGNFRDDLFWRLEVLTFRLAPLGARPGDVLPLAEAMLADLAARFGRAGARLSDAARAWLPGHPWPGNLRQLRNALERALLAADGEAVDPDRPREPAGAAPKSLAEVEAAAIREALAWARGHQGRAALALGISRKNLWEKRRRYGIP
jgi:two-component system response regulator AtoC